MVRCQVCSATEAHQALVDEVFVINGKYVLVESIPASICTRCGEATFSRETTERIRRLAHGEVPPVHTVALEVFAYAQGLNNATHARSRDS